MGSTRAGAGGGSTGRGADLLASAADLRWARPDLTAAIADHVLESAAIAGDQDRWLAAAGWVVQARSATGDGRETASDVIGQLSRWGRKPLDGPAARRLRVELAMVAAGAGEVDAARGLLGPVVADESEPELRADLLSVLARCAVEDAPDQVAAALQRAEEAWAAVPSPTGDIGAASVALISAVVERRKGRPDAAVDHAAEGLARLERSRGSGPSGTPSGHLAAALAAEWISALLDAGRADEARDGCVPLMPRLAEPARPSRQLALLRLTVARAVATAERAAGSVGLLEQAAEDAAASDAPDLESVCRTALGALQEKTGPLETALETLRLGVAAERRDRTRIARFREAVAELPAAGTLRPASAWDGEAGGGRSRAAGGSTDIPGASGRRRAAAEPAPPSGSGHDWEEFLRNADGTGRPASRRSERATESTGRGGRRRRGEDSPATDPPGTDVPGAEVRGEPSRRSQRAERVEPGHRDDGARDDLLAPASSERGSIWGSTPWDAAGGESPIGDLLFRSLRAEEGQDRSDAGSATRRRNGHRTGQDAGSRHGGKSADSSGDEPTRNGRRRRKDASSETVGRDVSNPDVLNPDVSNSDVSGWDVSGWDLPPDRPQEDDRTSRSRRGADGSGRDAKSGTASADSWLSDEARSTARASGRRARSEEAEDRSPLSDLAGRGESGRRSRRSAAEPRESASGPEPREKNGRGSGDGRRYRADDPWATGRWPSAAGEGDAESTREKAEADRNGPPTDVLPPASVARATEDPESWLRAALADLDRVWGATGPGGGPVRQNDSRSSGTDFSAGRSAGGRSSGSSPAASGAKSGSGDPCTVMIDVARDGRRFAGRRAGVVIRAVADRLTDRLPQGARLRLVESDALSITLPGWDRAAATEWMHRMLPGLLEGFDAGEELPSAQLRAAVHDADGPVGAQILQSLERPVGHRHGSEPERDTGRPGRRRASEPEARASSDAAPDPGRREAGYGTGSGGGQRHRRGAEESTERGEIGHRASSRTTDRGTDRGGSTSGDKSGAPGTATATDDAEGRTGRAASDSTEGLGIADLLAGALAAYRGI